MTKLIWPICAAALALTLAPAALTADEEKPAQPHRIYGPPAPAAARRIYGPQPAAVKPAAGSVKAAPAVTEKVASRTETKRSGKTEETAPAQRGSDSDRVEGRRRAVTIYFVHGEEKQSVVEFKLPETEVSSSAMTFDANKTEADVHDGKLLLRGDVHIRFASGLRLSAQLVSVTVNRDDGPVEIVVKE